VEVVNPILSAPGPGPARRGTSVLTCRHYPEVYAFIKLTKIMSMATVSVLDKYCNALLRSV